MYFCILYPDYPGFRHGSEVRPRYPLIGSSLQFIQLFYRIRYEQFYVVEITVGELSSNFSLSQLDDLLIFHSAGFRDETKKLLLTRLY